MAATLLAVSQPSGLWANLINWVHSFVGGGYGWTILVLIILVKIVMCPLDFLIKYSSKKTSLVQQKIAPQMAKLQKKYGDNRQMIQTQQQALYKREGYSVWGSCITMLINLVLTMVIFFTLFTGLRQLSSYQAITQYDQLHTTYVETVHAECPNYDELIVEYVADTDHSDDGDYYNSLISALEVAQSAVQAKWNDVADGWLWVKNIWVTDGHASPLPSFKDLKSMANTSKINEYATYVKEIEDDTTKVKLVEYNLVVGMVENKTGSWNGYYLLAVISVLLSIATQAVNDLANKNKNKHAQAIVNQANPQGKSAWFMKLLVPVMMAIFVFTTNAAFGIYVVTNSIMSTLIGFLTNWIIGLAFRKKQETVNEALEKEAEKIQRKANRGAR